MLRKGFAAAALVLALLTTSGEAQTSGVAIAALWGSGDVFGGYVGPFRAIPGSPGVDFHYIALCYDRMTQNKRAVQLDAHIPDGSTLTEIRTIATTAVVNACAEDASIIVPRAGVLLPAVQFGQ